MDFPNGLPLRSATFTQSVRLPGSSQTAFYIRGDEYPLTYFPQLHLIRASLRKGSACIQDHATARYYHVTVMKDMDLAEDPANVAASSTNGLLLLANSGNIRTNPETGVFERVADEPAASAAVEAPPTPAETQAAKHRGWPKGKPRGPRNAAPEGQT